MSPTPIALGMHLCDYLIVEEKTRRVSLINCFPAPDRYLVSLSIDKELVAQRTIDVVASGA